jgi:hypothetical protein
MNAREAAALIATNAALTMALVAGYAFWFAPARAPAFAVLDVGELYRLKEHQVAAVLVKRDASDEERTTALKQAAAFGPEVTALIQSLPGECRCLVLARGAVIGPAQRLPDLTPDVRRRLGL